MHRKLPSNRPQPVAAHGKPFPVDQLPTKFPDA